MVEEEIREEPGRNISGTGLLKVSAATGRGFPSVETVERLSDEGKGDH